MGFSIPSKTVFPKSSERVAYTKVLFVPEFYKDKLGSSLTSPGHDPINILKKMGSEHNWSSEIIKVLTNPELRHLIGAIEKALTSISLKRSV